MLLEDEITTHVVRKFPQCL